mgnify:CR=1 FL=1
MKRSKFQSKNQIPQNEKTAVVGDGVEGIDFEQKIILVWGKYRYAILIVIGVIVLSLLGYQMMFYLAERKELAVEAAFQEAESDEALLKFAREHPNHQLAGFAYLQLANKKYNENEFIQAIEYYTNAVSQLEDTSIKGRAHLGVAMAHLLTGNIEQGIETLDKITNDPLLLDTYRAEAAYQLAVYFWGKSDYLALDRELRRIETLKKSGMWIRKASVMRDSIPELRDLEGK